MADEGQKPTILWTPTGYDGPPLTGPTLTFYAAPIYPPPAGLSDLPTRGRVTVHYEDGEDVDCTYEVDENGDLTLHIPPPEEH